MSTITQHESTGTRVSKCDCHCTACQSNCCELECLVRPNFYGGQLLTDGNLKDMVDWVQAKSELKRFREGWGVVCGLDVECSHKDKEQNRVYVSQGYAVDCCGRDIVVCDPLWYDFSCERPFDPCCREPKPHEQNQPLGNAKDKMELLGEIPSTELRAYELCLVFDEKLGGGQRPLVRGDCYPMKECQFTKIYERGTLVAKEIKDPCAKTLIECDDKVYREQLKSLLGTLERLKSPKDLLGFVQGRLHSFCFVGDWLCELMKPKQEEKLKPKDVKAKNGAGKIPEELFLYIVQDFRNHYFRTQCETCTDNACDGTGVPLALVWMWEKQEGPCKICKVVSIDPYPPYRRPFRKGSQRLAGGLVDLSGYIWQDCEDVEASLRKQGFSNIACKDIKPGTLSEYSTWDGQNKDLLCASPESSLCVTAFEDICKRKRVVSFERQQKP